MTLFLLAAAIFGPACWVLGGAGYATKRLVGDACEMLERHVEGELNPWVLQEARCDELLDATETLGPIMISANAAVREANSGLSRALLLCRLACAQRRCVALPLVAVRAGAMPGCRNARLHCNATGALDRRC